LLALSQQNKSTVLLGLINKENKLKRRNKMRWNNSAPREGSERTVEKFLLFPKRLRLSRDNRSYETRWLETCKIRQIYKIEGAYLVGMSWGWEDYWWDD
jgi:hypothetical protein